MAWNKKKRAWVSSKGWRGHSFACYDREWQDYQECARLVGKSVNGWVRSWLNEAVRYERINEREREDNASS